MPDENDKPATKADISLLATKAELATLKTELKNDISLLATKAELASVKTDLTAQINRVAAAVVNTQADVRRIEQTMATKDDISRVLSAIDAFAKKSENQNNAVVFHGRALTDVHPWFSHKDLEGRLKALEARP